MAMARQILVVLLNYDILFSISSTLASDDSAATSFVQKTCDDATYVDVCLNTLLPSTKRINGNNKKAVRLALMSTISQVQSTNSNITHIPKQPKLLTREHSALKDCRTAITNSAVGLESAIEATNHLGGDSKSDKQDTRLSIEDSKKSVHRATNTCIGRLRGLRAREVLIRRVEQAMQPLVELATNAVDLIHHMEF